MTTQSSNQSPTTRQCGWSRSRRGVAADYVIVGLATLGTCYLSGLLLDLRGYRLLLFSSLVIGVTASAALVLRLLLGSAEKNSTN